MAGANPGRLDRAPGRGGRADRRLLLHGGRRVPLHDGPARADGARARGGAPVAAAAAPRARRPSCGACTCSAASTRRWPTDMVERGDAGPRARARDPRPRGARDHDAEPRERPGRPPPPPSSPSPSAPSSRWRPGCSPRGRWPSCCRSCWARWPRSPSGSVLARFTERPVAVLGAAPARRDRGRGRGDLRGGPRHRHGAADRLTRRQAGGRVAPVGAVDVVDGEPERAVERDRRLVGGVGVEHPHRRRRAGHSDSSPATVRDRPQPWPWWRGSTAIT